LIPTNALSRDCGRHRPGDPTSSRQRGADAASVGAVKLPTANTLGTHVGTCVAEMEKKGRPWA
jgi:hypothetical protein